MQTLVEQARSLSSGTIASLTDETHYTIIDSIQNDFIDFCVEIGDMFQTWQPAWKAFANLTRVNRNHVAAWRYAQYWQRVSGWFETREQCSEYCREHGIQWDSISNEVS